MKVRLVILEFSGYALFWWNQVLGDINRMRKAPSKSREKLNRLMRERFVPSYSTIDLYNKLQRLFIPRVQQCRNIVIDLMRAQTMESREATMTRFLHGLNREIQDIVKLQHYTILEELVHKTTKVELQLKRRHMSRKPYPSDSGRGKERGSPRKDKIPK
ncbi:hypothetical protein CR513_26294, partial [Mucuna pruriens]